MRRFVLAGTAAVCLAFLAQSMAQAGCGCCNCLNFGTDITIKSWKKGGCGSGPCSCGCCGCGACCGPCCGGGCCGCHVAPWYLYWPMEGHFQLPAPTGYPYWPAPMAAGGYPGYYAYAGNPYMGHGHYAPPVYGSGYAAQHFALSQMYQPNLMQQQPMFQTVGYSQQVPSYWYGR